jgi:hypothetical protein
MTAIFEAFDKIARLSRMCVITEKIDGTNAQIYIPEEGGFFTGSRNQWITPEQDNFGFSRWAHEHKERAGDPCKKTLEKGDEVIFVDAPVEQPPQRSSPRPLAHPQGEVMADRECICVETSPAPDAFDGIFHWRSDCPYLNDIERSMVQRLYGKPREALAKWHAAAIQAAENAALESAAVMAETWGNAPSNPKGRRAALAAGIRALKHPQADAETGK